MVFSFVWEKSINFIFIRQGAFATAQLVHAAIKRSTGAFSRSRLRRPAERRLNPAGVGGYLQLNVQILYIFCL